MPDLSVADYVKLVVPLVTAQGAATAAVMKVFWNGSTKKIQETHADVKDIRVEQTRVRDELKNEIGGVRERLVRVETRLGEVA
jgi:hypothetical protein